MRIEEIKSKFVKHINGLLYELSEIRYCNTYSSLFTPTDKLFEKILELDNLFNDCFGYSYLKRIKEYTGYCGSSICFDGDDE